MRDAQVDRTHVEWDLDDAVALAELRIRAKPLTDLADVFHGVEPACASTPRPSFCSALCGAFAHEVTRCDELVLDHVLDHLVAAAAVAARAARPRHLDARARTPVDGLANFLVTHGVADTDEHHR
jgi:hypothetical protein